MRCKIHICAAGAALGALACGLFAPLRPLQEGAAGAPASTPLPMLQMAPRAAVKSAQRTAVTIVPGGGGAEATTIDQALAQIELRPFALPAAPLPQQVTSLPRSESTHPSVASSTSRRSGFRRVAESAAPPSAAVLFHSQPTLAPPVNGEDEAVVASPVLTAPQHRDPFPTLPGTDDEPAVDSLPLETPSPAQGLIGGTVYYDADDDGQPSRAPEEFGFAGITVTLLREGEPLLEVRTDLDGDYALPRLAPGSYQVVIHPREIPPRFRISPRTLAEQAASGALVIRVDEEFPEVDFAFVSNARPLAVTDFAAAARPSAGVRLSWSAENTANLLGFHLSRSERINGPRSRITSELLGLQISPNYQFDDEQVAGGRYFYWLECVDAQGETVVRGPVLAVVPANQANVRGEPGSFVVGLNKVTDEVLAAAGLARYSEVCVLVDGVEVPLFVVPGSHIIFYVPKGAQSVAFGLSRSAKRMSGVELRFD